MALCKNCGSIAESDNELCSKCKSKQATIDKLCEFHLKMLPAEEHFYNVRSLENTLRITQQSEYSNKSTWFAFTVVTLVCIVMVFTIVFIPVFAYYLFKEEGNSRNKFYEQKEKNIEILNAQIQKEYCAIAGIYESTNKFVSTNYAEPVIVRALIRLLRDGRADSLKEVINLYENIKHTDEMMRLQQEISYNSKVSAVTNTVSAFANVNTAINTRR